MSRLAELLKQKALSANSASRANPESSISNISKFSKRSVRNSQLAPDLEHRIHTMARRWQYTEDDLAEVLTLAAVDPYRWLLAVHLDERKFGNGDTVVVH